MTPASRSTAITRSLRIPGRVEVRRVDDGQDRIEVRTRILGIEVQPALHAGDVGVRRLDVQPRTDAMLRVVADVPVDDEHVLIADVRVLTLGDLRAVGAAHRLVRVLLGPVGDDVGAGLASRNNLGLHVVVVVFGVPGIRHVRRQLAQLRGGRVPADVASRRQAARAGLDDVGHDSSNAPGARSPPARPRSPFQAGIPDVASIAKGLRAWADSAGLRRLWL